LLDRIRKITDTRLVIVTGRRSHDAARLLGLKHIEVWGCHGLERLRADGTFEMSAIDEHLLHTISEADELLTSQGLSELLEHKPAGTAVHWRGRESIAAEVRQKVHTAWASLKNRHGLCLEDFDGGMEIRVAATNKGDVVRAILSEMTRDSVIAYLGDDRTDEDAFVALDGRGLGVLVRTEFRETEADVWLRPPEGVLTFLTAWLAACGGAS
jgi:trehalose-phosphatase